MRHIPRSALSVLLAALVGGCSALPPAVERVLPADALLLGEQHDAPEHQRLHRDTVQTLAQRGVLAALTLEMADQGTSTAGLSREATEAQVRTALRWSEPGWPWPTYAPAVMAAVRAGVPVLGANLPGTQMRAAMADATLDGLLPATALADQREAIRSGHCDLLPATQIAPMTRIQIARDRAMAATVVQAAQAERTVVLLAGSAHVDAQRGVPQHLPPGWKVKSVTWPEAPPQKDYCASLRASMRPVTAPAPAAPASR